MNYVSIENYGKKKLEQFPIIKRVCKRIYQFGMYATSNEKIKSEGNVVKVSPDDEYEYFFGYYDKSPWDMDDRYIICLRVRQAYKSVAPKEYGELVLLDTANDNKPIIISRTYSWNVQQGCMAQWLGPDFKTRIIFNDFRNGNYCSVVYNVKEMKEEHIYDCAVYDVAKDASYALSLDFSRLHRMRPGYGYSNLDDNTKNELCPDKGCIWKLDLRTGKKEELKKYTDFASFEEKESMHGAEHKVNHLMISPDGSRLMILHRWFKNGRKYTRLVTMNSDGTEMYNLSDDTFVSHCYWKNNNEILAFLRKKENGDHYYLMKDKTKEYKMYWPELNTDGHCSYSPNGRYIITDTYPNRKRLASIYLCKEDGEYGKSKRIARVFSPFRYDNECRCDLHPRWNHTGDTICIDSVHNGKRGLYIINITDHFEKDDSNQDMSVSVVIPTHNRKELLRRAVNSVMSQTYPIKEIIVISDGSDDGTNEMMKEWSEKESKIKFISYNPGKGGNYARNLGIKTATTRFVAFLDDDDEWHIDKIEKQIDCFRKDDKIGLVCTAMNNVHIVENTTNLFIPPVKYSCEKEILLKNCIGSTTTAMVKRELFDKVGMFDESLPALQDYDMWVRLCQISKVEVVSTPCVEYYNYENSNQISKDTCKYIQAEKLITYKYRDLISKLSESEQKTRKCYFNMLISKKGMRNGQPGIAFKYAIKAIYTKPCKSSIICLIASLVPYKLSLKIRKHILSKGLN